MRAKDFARRRATPRLALIAARTGLVVAVIVASATGNGDAAASCAESTGATRSAVRAAMEHRRSGLGDIPGSVADRGVCIAALPYCINPAYPVAREIT